VAFRQGVECGFQGRTNKLVDGCYSFWQGAAIALTQKLVMIIDEQLKLSYSCKKPSGEDACGTSSSGCTSEKSSSGETHDCPYFFHEMKNTSLFFVYGKFKTSLLFLANKRGKAYHAAMHLQLNQAI